MRNLAYSIVEINAEDMYAVVESGCTWATGI